jgi:hypothetical protein
MSLPEWRQGELKTNKIFHSHYSSLFEGLKTAQKVFAVRKASALFAFNFLYSFGFLSLFDSTRALH